MKHKSHDRRDKALIRQVERAIRAERVSLFAELKRHLRRLLTAIKRVDGSVEALAREVLRQRQAPRVTAPDNDE